MINGRWMIWSFMLSSNVLLLNSIYVLIRATTMRMSTTLCSPKDISSTSNIVDAEVNRQIRAQSRVKASSQPDVGLWSEPWDGWLEDGASVLAGVRSQAIGFLSFFSLLPVSWPIWQFSDEFLEKKSRADPGKK